MKKMTVAGLLLIALGVLAGCTQRATKSEETFVPTYDFSPPATAKPASAEVAFALVNAQYSENQPWTILWPFTDFSRNMNLDFQEILNARGFTVRGPFTTYDEVTFVDKKASDLILQPNLDIRVDVIDPKYTKNFNILGADTYTMSGQASVGGRITLSLYESLSKERMWFKSIEIPRQVIEWAGEKSTANPSGVVDWTDRGLTTPLARTLEVAYAKILDASWKYLDPEEMRLVKKQSQEIRSKKVY